MEVIIQSSPERSAALAAKMVARLVREKPDAVLGLPTGGTPVPLYAELVRLHREEKLDFAKVRTFNLDEYVGLASDNASSYHAFMRGHLFDHINVQAKNIHIPDGMAKDISAACNAYEEAIRKTGGIDMQLLGIGTDGHIGFNEPSSSLSSRTRLKTLTDKTMHFNQSHFAPGQKVPRYAITMGVGTIMDAKQCVLLASGSAKASVVQQMIEGPVTAMVPASVLQMHPRTTIILDDDAAKSLRLKDYYRFVYGNKPDWQRCE